MSKSMIKVIEDNEKKDEIKIEFGNSKKLKSHLQSAMNTATSLVNYIPKITSEFEMVVERSIRNSLMSVNSFGSIQVIDNEVVAVSKIVKPIIKVENPNKKLKVKFVNQPNEDKTLIPVNTTNMDKMWKSFSGTDTKKPSTDKSDIKTSASKFYNDLHKVYDLAKNKNYNKFWSVMSEDTLETILNIGVLISDNKIRDAYTYCESNQQADGNIKKAS